MNWIDLIILLVIFLFAIEGQKRGFFVQVIDILGFLVSLIVALTFYPQGAQLLIKLFNLPKIAA
ncbi:CvpA family protein, partial [Candidatus Curtissbacteria bacterium]|nr:CvpA family protein [Candidatus Curtissbacteria bacterium]